MKRSVILALFYLAIGAGGCSSMGGKAAREGPAADPTGPTPAAVSFTQADLDSNARITPREFDLWAAGNTREHGGFSAADTNHDGVLTLDEWQAMATRPSAVAGASRAPSARSP